ncbi:MAG: hypothetical protein AB7O97_13750 [Planctomycetota bacterium]
MGNNGGVDRGADRPVRVDGKRDKGAAGSASGGKASGGVDRASISSDGRDAKAAFEAHVAAAKAEEPDREARVARAMERLISGELDNDAVYRDVAGRLLQGDFRSV